MATVGVVDSKGHLELKEDPEAWIKSNPASRLAFVTSLTLYFYLEEEKGESIGELTQLIRLEFNSCGSLKRVPNAVNRLHKLEHLEFHYCECLEELPANIGNLVSLTHLKLKFCNNIKYLPNSIVNLSKLTSLSLDFCNSLVELPANIGQLASLTHLDLSYCRNIKSLPMSVANLPKLTSLSLSSLSLSEIPCNLGDLKSLNHLQLSDCNNVKYLPNSIANLSNLTSLSLKKCGSLVELPAIIGQLVSLTHLELNNCSKIKSLPDSMTNLCNLDTLFIDKCNSLKQLPVNLNVLHLKLIDCCLPFLPTGLINLKYLRVPFCSCSDKSFANLNDPCSLQHLSITSCFRHTNPIVIKVPANLNQFVNLQVLSLCAEHTFKLPTNLDGLARLCLVNIRYSSIKCLPSSITKLRKLRLLMLPNCFRLETLPYELNNSVIISVDKRHVRKSWGELKTEMGELPIRFGAEVGNDAAQILSFISPPGYLRLKRNPSQWIINKKNLLKLVRFLELEYVEELTDSIMQFSKLTHLYLHIIGDICLPDSYFVTFTRLTHLYLHFYEPFEVANDESVIHSLSKLSNLQTLHLCLFIRELPENFNMPVGLKHLSLSSCNMRPLYDSLEKLTNLKSLDLNSCSSCELLPPSMYSHKLRLVDCSLKSLDSLPIGLRHLEILFLKIHKDLGCMFEESWNQLINLETLSITCFKMEFLPEEIARLRNLQKLQLKDCVSLKKLPANLHQLVNLHTLDISVTGIKTLPLTFVKLCNLKHLILPKCFNFERLPRNLKQVSIIDDTEEEYFKSMRYNASLYQTSVDTSDGRKDEEAELCVVPGESSNEDNNVVPTVEIHETVPDEQSSADPFNSTSMGYIEHITTEQGNGGVMTNLPGAYSFGVNNQHAINDGQIGTMTFENAHETAPIFQHISSSGGSSFIGACNNDHALEFRRNNNTFQSYDADAIRQGREITPEATLEPWPATNMILVDAAENLDGFYSSRRENSNPEGESIPATHTDQNDIMTTEIEQGNGDNSHHDSENEQNQIPQNNNVKGKKDPCYNRGETSNPSGECSHAMQNTFTQEIKQGIAPTCDTKEIDCGEINHCALESEQNYIPQSNNVRVKIKRKDITLEMLQPFWSNHTKLVDAAEELGVGRSTLKRRLKKLGVEWRRKGTKQDLDAKKRKLNNKAPFGSDCSQQNLVNLGNSAADHAENVEEHIMGSDLHTLPNHVSSNSNVVINLTPDATMETIRGNSMETIDSHQGAEVNLDGANEHTLSDTLPQNEKSSNFIVKATCKDDTIRFDFSLSKSIDQLKKEVGKRLDIEVSTFKLKYQDEEKEWILLTCISDLEHALNLLRSSNDTNVGSVVRLLVVLKA